MAASIQTPQTLITVDAFRKLVNENFSKQIREGQEYDPRDIQRFNEVDGYTSMFTLHRQYSKTFDEKKALSFFHDAMVWRKQNNVYDISPDCFPAEYIERRSLFYENHDINNCPILYSLVRKINNEEDDVEEGNRFLTYRFEEQIQAHPGQRIIIFLDMSETGLKHLDYDRTKFLMNSVLYYYPGLVSHILVYKLPLILAAAWQIIKSWLPSDTKHAVKFVDGKSILQYISRDQISNEVGGFACDKH